jgi:hypothetical protein
MDLIERNCRVLLSFQFRPEVALLTLIEHPDELAFLAYAFSRDDKPMRLADFKERLKKESIPIRKSNPILEFFFVNEETGERVQAQIRVKWPESLKILDIITRKDCQEISPYLKRIGIQCGK